MSNFNVAVNGHIVARDIDVFEFCGGSRACAPSSTLEFTVTTTEPVIEIVFGALDGSASSCLRPQVSTIRIYRVKKDPHNIIPLRISETFEGPLPCLIRDGLLMLITPLESSLSKCVCMG